MLLSRSLQTAVLSKYMYNDTERTRLTLDDGNFTSLGRLSEQKTDTLAVVCPADAFCDGGADVYCYQLAAVVGMHVLWDRVGDLASGTHKIALACD